MLLLVPMMENNILPYAFGVCYCRKVSKWCRGKRHGPIKKRVIKSV